MEYQSIYFEINLNENLEARADYDLEALPADHILDELFVGCAVLVDRQGNCMMLNDISVSGFIRQLDALMTRAEGQPGARFPLADPEGEFVLEGLLDQQTFVLGDPGEPGEFRLEFDFPALRSLFAAKKRNAGTLFWLLYPELNSHREAGQLRRFFEA